MRIFCAPRSGGGADKSGSADVYALLGYAFSLFCGQAALPEIQKTPNGKPYFPGRPEIHFSLSHARTHVLCAISHSPVGADIESPRSVSDRAVRYFASPEESRLFEPLELWVLKESYIKLLGATLPAVKTLRFSLDGGNIIPPSPDVTARLYQIAGCRAAVCSRGKTPPAAIELAALTGHSTR